MAIDFDSAPLLGWIFKQGDRHSDEEWLEAGNPPTEVHRDLVRQGKAPDYRRDLNELAVRWIADETWTYRTTFQRPEDHGKKGVKIILNFEGLDTFASVYLNNKLILSSDNMFVQHRVDVTGHVSNDQHVENELIIVFESARLKGLELIKQHPEHRFIVHQTEISRGPVRKAQYHWGWDWGPIIMTCGPTKPITLETYTGRLDDLWVQYELSADLKTARVRVQVQYEGEKLLKLYLRLLNNQTGKAESGHELRPVPSQTQTNLYEVSFVLNYVELWWPRGYGPQSTYTVNVFAVAANDQGIGYAVHSIVQKTGFRQIDLIQEPDLYGQSFYFRINNVDVFVGGSCWIPVDNDLSRPSESSYEDWIRLAAEGNQTMIRVWGGGVYEPDAFYEAADALGVLVWQDFMFACANYPAHAEYLQSVELEARQNVRRLRRHPSIVIWAGNNEDYQIVERYGLQYDTGDDAKKDPESWLKTNFPARYIYEHLLPQVIETETSGVPYHPSSPFGNGKSTVLKVDPTIGDVHQWNVWHGTMQPYQQLPEMGGRFVSEFGMEAYPHLDTLKKCITRQEDRRPGSMAMDFRNKAIGHERRLVSYVAENFRLRYDDLEGFAHLTQVMQADAVGGAYRAWRRRWGQKGYRKCGGVLVWQLNDCWPTVSWAVVDYHGVPKPAYYAIKRAMQPIAVGVQRRFRDWTMRPADHELWQRDTSHIDMRSLWEDDVRFDVWVASDGQKDLDAKLTVKFISVKTGKEVAKALVKDVAVRVNGTTEVFCDERVDVPGKRNDSREPFDMSKTDPFVIYATLHRGNRLISSDCSWPDPIKYLSFPDRGVRVEYSDSDSDDDDKSITAVVTADKPVKGFVFSEVPEVSPLSDNGFDIMPGEKRVVRMTSDYPLHRLKWRYVEAPITNH